MKKPSTVKWIIGLSIFRMAIGILLVIAAAFVLYNKPESTFFQGIADGIIENFSLSDPYGNPAYSFGRVLGAMLIPFLLMSLEIVFIRSRKRVGFWICTALDFLFTLSSISLPIMPIVLLILGLNKSTKLYFKGESEEMAATDILDQDLK